MGDYTNGWIKLHRIIFDNGIWNEKPFSRGQAWIDLLLLAEAKTTKVLYKGEMIICYRGTVNRSILSLSERWGWSRKKATVFLELLKKQGMIDICATKHRTVINLLNYETYQGKGTASSTTNGTTSDTPPSAGLSGLINQNTSTKEQQNGQPRDNKRCNKRYNHLSKIGATESNDEDTTVSPEISGVNNYKGATKYSNEEQQNHSYRDNGKDNRGYIDKEVKENKENRDTYAFSISNGNVPQELINRDF